MNTSSLIKGIILLVSFTAVLILIFMPIYGGGKNGLEFSDDFFNALSKGSSDYMDDMRELAKPLVGQNVTMDLKLASDEAAKQTEPLFAGAGAQVTAEGANLKVNGDLGKIILKAVDDADAMFHNQPEKLKAQYQYDAKKALKNWWLAFGAMDKALKRQKRFKLAKAINEVSGRALEPAYNFYGIVPTEVKTQIPMLTFMLVFYVIYTLWFGYGIYEVFEGLGLTMAKTGVKKEV